MSTRLHIMGIPASGKYMTAGDLRELVLNMDQAGVPDDAILEDAQTTLRCRLKRVSVRAGGSWSGPAPDPARLVKPPAPPLDLPK